MLDTPCLQPKGMQGIRQQGTGHWLAVPDANCLAPCALVFAALLFASCARENGQRPPTREEAQQKTPMATPPAIRGYEITSAAGTYVLEFSPPPDQMPLNEMFSMTVKVSNSADRSPADDVELAVDAAMPAHRHGMNTRPKAVKNPDGSFDVKGMLLHMSGDWEIYFDILRAGDAERAQVKVVLE
jgi:hypothetical protein